MNAILHDRGIDCSAAGREMYRLIEDLYPICRSITGDGVRETLRRIGRFVPLMIHEVPTGTKVFDWTIPREWNIREAHIKNREGEKIVDFLRSNLHVLNYSIPVHKVVTREELRAHVHTLPEYPEWIPYRTSYYKEAWGFCLSQRQWESMNDPEYEVSIDATLADGSLTYGEFYLAGAIPDEVLVSCHVCHPSLCNDNLSGVSLVAFVAMILKDIPRRYSYRFLFVPGTIGAITWLAKNEATVSKIRHGLVVACVGDPGPFTYKKSRRGDAEIDKAVAHILGRRGIPYSITEFSPYGYDERQYCSPGFNLPVGSLTRTPNGRYPEYHTSADDLMFVRPESLGESLQMYLDVIEAIETNRTYINLNPKCEPQLGKRGLYEAIVGRADTAKSEMAMMWVLNLSDGGNSLLDISERSGFKLEQIKNMADVLLDHGLLEEIHG
jgi:aminopeptidase-like protein